MKSVKIIIGANYGDEGKGLATNHFAEEAQKAEKLCLNILYNGGCQRGHTVETADGKRHVFHHFGAGTFAGAETYFDKDFIVNPMEFMREYRELEQMGVKPICYISPECRVTTPFDMMLNQIIEDARGEKRHGSCGMGIFETRRRYGLSSSTTLRALKFQELAKLPKEHLKLYLQALYELYFKYQLDEFGIDITNTLFRDFDCAGAIEHFISDFYDMMLYVIIDPVGIYTISPFDVFIFEGGQGLALDENYNFDYPYLTPSMTGSGVPLHRIEHCRSLTDIEVVYVTRSYFTRHGAGKFPTECNVSEINSNIVDDTNHENEFQGKLRYGRFDCKALLGRIDDDKNAWFPRPFKRSLLVTHLNETGGDICGDITLCELAKRFDEFYTSSKRTCFDE